MSRIDDKTLAALADSAAETLAPEAPSPLLLLCEHAGAEIPAPWGTLGLDRAYLDTHYAYDAGAGPVTRHLSQSLSATAVLSRYSRLFLDYNRFPEDWDRIRPDMGGIPVPANLVIDAEERHRRESVAVTPVHAAVERCIPGKRAVVSIHSFTPVMGGERRDVDVAILWDVKTDFVRVALEALADSAGAHGLRPGDNAPYDLRSFGPRSLKTHAADHGLPYFYVEVNSGLFSRPQSAAAVMSLLDETLTAVIRRQAEWSVA